MNRRLVLAAVGSLGLAAIIAMGLGAARWETASALTNCTIASEGMDGEENTVARLVNEQRAAAGLPALLVAPSLNRAAAWKSADPSNTGGGSVPFGHTDSLGRAPSQRAGDCGYPGQAAENIAYGYSASGVVTAWMGSAGHRANILGSYYTVMGVGHTGTSWVLNFGITVESGSYPIGGGTPPTAAPTSTPSPTRSAPNPTATPTSAPGGSASGGSVPPATATAPLAGATQAAVSTATRTATPAGTPIPQHKLPTTVPIKRAMVQMVASE